MLNSILLHGNLKQISLHIKSTEEYLKANKGDLYIILACKTPGKEEKGFEEKNLQIPHFLTFRPFIHQGIPQMTLLCRQESYPKSRGSAHRFPVPI